MELAVFLRGINVGGRTLRTADLAASLAPLLVANVGAAGTFAVANAGSEKELRDEVLRRIPFPSEAVVVRRARLRELLGSLPHGHGPPGPGTRRSVTILAGRPRAVPTLPLERPDPAAWEVRLISFQPPFVAGEHLRRYDDRILYPNEVVEREFGVPATTRWWETLLRVEEAFRHLQAARRADRPVTRRPGPGSGRSGSRGPAPRGPSASGRRSAPRTR